jgi:hypothetical protein
MPWRPVYAGGAYSLHTMLSWAHSVRHQEMTGLRGSLARLGAARTPEPDGTLRIAIDLWPTAHRFLAGHRLRLQVSSGAHPRFSRNTGSGEPLATARTLVAADQSVFHDPEHPSALLLPVMG